MPWAENRRSSWIGWIEKHQDSCNSNFTGSSPAMETEGTSILWGSSVEKNRLRYTTVLPDGNAKSILRLNNEHPYGGDGVIEVITFMLILLIFIVICLHLK